MNDSSSGKISLITLGQLIGYPPPLNINLLNVAIFLNVEFTSIEKNLSVAIRVHVIYVVCLNVS